MMRRILPVFALVGAVAATALAQTPNSTRPRVAVTPTPAPPTIQGDVPADTRRGGPPVLGGDSRRPMPAPTAVPQTADDGSEVIKVETNLITMPVSVLDREGRFTYLNSAAEVLLERRAEDLLGRLVGDCFPAARESMSAKVSDVAQGSDAGRLITDN